MKKKNFFSEQILQFQTTGEFKRFDYRDENFEIYGSSTPIEYDLRQLDMPVYIYHQSEDKLISLVVRDKISFI